MPRFRRLLVVFAALFLLVSVAGRAGEVILTTLVIEGQVIDGIGVVTRIDNLAINDAGDWLVEVDTDNADTDADQVVLRNGALFLREGDALAEPVPGMAGELNTLELSGALPGDTVGLVLGLQHGVTPIPACDDLTLAVGDIHLIGTEVADGAGNATFSLAIPPQAAGKTVLFQGIDLTTCDATHLVVYNFP